MYMILYWVNDNYLTCIKNTDGSIRLFETLQEADKFANEFDSGGEKLRVISIEGVA